MSTTAIPRFDLSQVNRAVEGTEFAGRVQHLPTIPSTNSFALAIAQSGARHGVWIADEQTAGRGRGTHTWHSTAGEGLYMSAIVAPPVSMGTAQHLSFRTAMAVQSAIASTFGFKVREQIDIRWPNDIMFARHDGPQRKLGGILIETSANPAPAHSHATLRFAVIGVGVNLNHTNFPAGLDSVATSIRREMPQPAAPLRREALAAAILLSLGRELGRLTAGNAVRDFTPFSSWISGKRVRVEARDGNEGYAGTTAGLDGGGFLRVTTDDGAVRMVLSGGVREI